ncbi:MAG: signal recognition particle-docking protein FtsY [Acaryochloris sp. RU_4_1]|nr:signal recognition particle-docking protein FtsY [Acaryochloris sp. SU_5_25]NJM66980.1 signal recognition particle-docking protein FtsY [Acaryochloris sp. RU_4_1]NJR55858.1 signal recognition particle-docking protein FtsY [Acaryochloris sp. CRU_2_0]
MVFNWFRRQFNKEDSDDTDTTSAIAAESETTDAITEDDTRNAEDDHSWAKTAFQKIQERQQDSAPEEIPTAAIPADSTPSTLESPPLTDAAETGSMDSEKTHQREADTIDATISHNADSANIPASSPVPDPVVAAAPTDSLITPPTPPTSTDLTFDEGFVWSAAVLAAQGRRPGDVSVEEISWLQKLRQGLGKTRRGLVNQLKSVVGQGPLNIDAVLEIESLLLQADVGIAATDKLIESLQNKVREETLPPEAAIAYLKQIMQDILDAPTQTHYSANFAPQRQGLNIWLMTGVNGAGKTTTIGKIAHIAKESGYSCLIAAADTFRAAAVEQVKIWGQRSNVEVIANPGQNTDPAAVVFDAITAAQKRDIDLLLVDTAGRLQNKKNLMDELHKVRRIVSKKAPDAHIESLLVLDATLGQNGLRQAQVFAEAAELTGVVLTKLDGSAKGGVALAVVQELGLPIRFIGAGEGITDLRPFSSYEFVEALLST